MTSQPTRADAVLTANIQRIIQHSKIRGQKSFLFHSSEWFLMEKRVEEALGKEGKQIRIRRKGTYKITIFFYCLLQQCHTSYNRLINKRLCGGRKVALVATNVDFN